MNGTVTAWWMKPCWKPTIMEKVRYILIFLYPNLCSSLRWSRFPKYVSLRAIRGWMYTTGITMTWSNAWTDIRSGWLLSDRWTWFTCLRNGIPNCYINISCGWPSISVIRQYPVFQWRILMRRFMRCPKRKPARWLPSYWLLMADMWFPSGWKNIFGSIRLKNTGMCLLMEKWLTFTVLWLPSSKWTRLSFWRK